MTTKETLHKLVDFLPESEWEEIRQVLEEHLAKHDPVLRAFLDAPEDDEPETEEEREAVKEAYEDLKAGRVVTWEELKRELDL
jgi:uncharacterized coiled-coil DUF342 family protein